MADEETPDYTLTLEDGTVVHTSREFTGCGRAVYANGEVYDGDFDEGVRHGKGTYWYRNGDVYTGQFQENEKHGMGRLVYTGRKVPNDDEDGEVDEGGTSAQGSTYHGQFKEGEKHGQGTYKYNNGDVYSGDWAKGRKHGRGTYVYEDGSSLEGKWKEGSLMAGTWTLPSGVRFLGDFKENKPFGEGKWEMPCRQGHTVSGKYYFLWVAVSWSALGMSTAELRLKRGKRLLTTISLYGERQWQCSFAMTEPLVEDVLSGRLLKFRNKPPVRQSLAQLLNEGGTRLRERPSASGIGDYVAQGIAEVTRIVDISAQDCWREKFVRLGMQWEDGKARNVLFMEEKVIHLAGGWVDAAPGQRTRNRAMTGYEHILTVYVPFAAYKYPMTFAFSKEAEMKRWADRLAEACNDELVARDRGLGRLRVALLSVAGRREEGTCLEVSHSGYSVRSAPVIDLPVEVRDVPIIQNNPNAYVELSIWSVDRGTPVKGLEVHCPFYEIERLESQIVTYETPLDAAGTDSETVEIRSVKILFTMDRSSMGSWPRYFLPVQGEECGWPQGLTLTQITDGALTPSFRRIGRDFAVAQEFWRNVVAIRYFERPMVSLLWFSGLSLWVLYLYEYSLSFVFTLGALSLVTRHPLVEALTEWGRGGLGRFRCNCKVEEGEALDSMDVYESERRLFVFADFSPENLLLWDPPQWSTPVLDSAGQEELVPCKGPRTVMSDGSCWSWRVVVDSNTDENGYQYAMSFGEGSSWMKESDVWCYVRRRVFRGTKVKAGKASPLMEKVTSVQFMTRPPSSFDVDSISPCLSPTPAKAVSGSTVLAPWEAVFNKVKQNVEEVFSAVLTACIVFEKMKNLFAWKCPWASLLVLIGLLSLAMLSLFVPPRYVVEAAIVGYFLSGLLIGIDRRRRHRRFVDELKRAAKSKRRLRSFVSHPVIDTWALSTCLKVLGFSLLALCGWVADEYQITIDLRTMETLSTIHDLMHLVACRCPWFYTRDSSHSRLYNYHLLLGNVLDHVPTDCDLYDPRSITFRP